ncbi:DUF434 domain-containing protein [Thermococcus nautili]|uniref:DUF434 domain-containing protein n=1 Tax=Thermococcus nautili TaxID=195522 RepID=W8P481_9EURY|nr:DUF434 domain-containing protein [Thermococcus nautili]AHL23626.1 hypothetical protein BD01_2028 [Thermococcus nautili]CAI1492301.1 conserved protein of unknown function [Thermococcus nautili]
MLAEAYRDLKYLLNRGYRKSVALDFVANHYRLRKEERHLLARCAFPDSWIEEVKRKLLRPDEIRGRVLGVDGFNVLITLESLLAGRAILCEDGLIRDLAYRGKYRPHGETGNNLRLIVSALAELSPGRAVFFYGKNNPGSGVVRKLTEELLDEFGVPGEVRLVKSPDHELKAFETVATADVGVIEKAGHVFDLAEFAGRLAGAGPVPLHDILKTSSLLESLKKF